MIPRSDFTGDKIDLHEVRQQARVTDFALLRYLERVFGLPVEQIRAGMLTDAVLQAMAMSASSVHGAGYKLVIDNFEVVSTLATKTAAIPAAMYRGQVASSKDAG